jgi:phage/plasmid-like protein (TIGR03299 family)
MSRETMQWLNTMTLIGYKDKRGTAWHHRAEYQGDEPNHYAGPVPVEDVMRRLFSWQAKAAPLRFVMPERITDDGVSPATEVVDESRQVIYNGNTGEVFYVASDGYAIHQYDEWLLRNVANILDDDLGIGSAGLLEGGGVGWVQVELPEPVRGPGEFDFRPYLLALTSHNGSRATGYNRAACAVVCDNTLAGGGERRRQFPGEAHARFVGADR